MTRAARFVSLSMALLGSCALAADWPQWLGPNRNGSSPETGLNLDWQAKAPKVLWKVPGGKGFSSFAVAGGRAYTLIEKDNEELAIALDAKTGKEVWKQKLGPAFKNQFGDGPRSTPTVEGKQVFFTSVNGPVVCMEADSGKVVWQTDLLKEFGGKNITWGLSASPVIDGDLVLVIPGAKGASVAALDKKSGKVVWKTGDDKASYASPTPVTVGGKKQAVFFTASSLCAVDTTNGKELWRMPWEIEYEVNICTPVVVGDSIFVSSGENVGYAMLKLGGDKPTTEWGHKGPKGILTTYWANAVVHDGHFFAMAGEFTPPMDLNCVDAKTGKLAWSRPKFGKGSITLAEGHLFITTSTGDLVLVPANSKAFQEKGRIKVFGRENRYATTAAIADKLLFMRDNQEIACIDLGK